MISSLLLTFAQQTLKVAVKNEKAEIQLGVTWSPGTAVNGCAVAGLSLMKSVRAATASCDASASHGGQIAGNNNI